MDYAKGSRPTNVKYARGGDVVTTRSRFFKGPDSVRTGITKVNYEKSGKGGTLSKTEGESKKLPAVKPRS